MRRVRLTKTVCDAARYRGRSYQGAGGAVYQRCVLWDAEQRGFGLRITPAGEKTFVVKYVVSGRSRVMTLGRYGELTVGEARERAAKARGLGAKWSDIDMAAGRWHLKDAKGGPRTVYLSAPAQQVLASLPREAGAGGAFLFPSPSREGQPRATLAKPWERIRQRLGWPDLRLHDLRRSHGSLAVGGGESLLVVSRLLGHKSQAVTDRVYAPLAADPAAAAAERVGRAMAAALAGGEGGEVVPMRPRG